MLVKLLNQVHPDYDESELAQLDALFEGGRKWRALKDTWFPKYARECEEAWQERKGVACYTNHAGPIVSMLSAMLFSSPPDIDAGTDPFWQQLEDNCDRQGTPLPTFLQEGLDAAQVGRRWYCWVNMPSREGAQVENQADEDALRLRDAFLVGLTPRQVRNWGRDGQGLAWIMARGLIEGQESPVEAKVRKYRWTAVTRTEVIQWEWTATAERPEPGPEEDASETLRVAHGLGRLPVVEIVLPPGLWTMGKLADPALQACRADNDLGWALHQAANELLVITSQANAGEVVLGHGAYLLLPQDSTAEFVAPSGVAFEHLERKVDSDRQELYRVVHQMAVANDPSASQAKASGESKAMDWQALGIILAAYQGLVLDALREILGIVAELRGEKTATIEVGGLEGWRTEDLGAWLEQVILAPDAARLSPTYRKEVAKHQARRLLGDHVAPKVLDTILDEIDKAPNEEPEAYPVGPGQRVEKPPPADGGGAGE